MSAARGSPRWSLSFADLVLLLLGFFVLLAARPHGARALADGLRPALGGRPAKSASFAAPALFEPGEAVLLGPARARLAALAGGAGRVEVESRGSDPATDRFDGWELAAARAAAVARALAAAGLPADRVTLSVLPGEAAGQRIRVTAR